MSTSRGTWRSQSRSSSDRGKSTAIAAGPEAPGWHPSPDHPHQVEELLRVLLQRVSRAEVKVGERSTGRIGKGLLLLAGFTHVDGEEQLAWMSDRILGLRVFPDEVGKMNRSIIDAGGALLLVSQFTLYGDTRKGRRPGFADAASPDLAIPLYERFTSLLRASGLQVETGEFGAMMQVELVNDGPVTLMLER